MIEPRVKEYLMATRGLTERQIELAEIELIDKGVEWSDLDDKDYLDTLSKAALKYSRA